MRRIGPFRVRIPPRPALLLNPAPVPANFEIQILGGCQSYERVAGEGQSGERGRGFCLLSLSTKILPLSYDFFNFIFALF